MEKLTRVAYMTPSNMLDIKYGWSFIKDSSVVFIIPDGQNVATVDDGFASCIYVDKEYCAFGNVDNRSDIDIFNEISFNIIKNL